jgi:hypothetical protein
LRQAYERDGFTCQDCKSVPAYSRYITPLEIGGENVLSNVITRCYECIKLAHNKWMQNPDYRQAIEKRERKEWEEHQETVRRKYQQNPMLLYIDRIRGIKPSYEKTFEENEEDEVRARKLILEPERMMSPAALKKAVATATTATEKKRLKNKEKLMREEKKQYELDQKYLRNVSPQKLFYEMIASVGCKCCAGGCGCGPGVRDNPPKFCKTCILISEVREYMLRKFRDAASGGRSSLE